MRTYFITCLAVWVVSVTGATHGVAQTTEVDAALSAWVDGHRGFGGEVCVQSR